jgi:hypothetical protein
MTIINALKCLLNSGQGKKLKESRDMGVRGKSKKK